jgi:hypothetical protein
MDSSRNDLLGELAADAALERSDFLVAAAAQLDSFLDANEARIRELGGLVLIDDDVDYLAIDEDMTFRSRSRYRDEATGKWMTETETIESAAELVELYNPADIFAAFADATAEQVGPKSEAAAEAAKEEVAAGENPYAEAADEWAAGHEFEEAPETEEEAAERLYDLALAFQERSQRTEANLLEQFETAAAALTSVLGELIVVDDDDERLTLRANGSFVAEVVPEEGAAEGRWERLDNPDEIVKFYDPTDIFGDLADSLAESFPELNEEAPEEGEEAEEGEEGEEAEEEAEPAEGEEAEEKAEAEGDSKDKEDGDSR